MDALVWAWENPEKVDMLFIAAPFVLLFACLVGHKVATFFEHRMVRRAQIRRILGS